MFMRENNLQLDNESLLTFGKSAESKKLNLKLKRFYAIYYDYNQSLSGYQGILPGMLK